MLQRMGELVVDGLSELSLHLVLLSILAVLPLLFLVRWRIYPHRALVALLLIPALASVLLLLSSQVLVWVLCADLTIASFALAEILTLPRRRDLSAHRKVERVASLGKPHAVELTVVHSRTGGRRMMVWIRDDVPSEFEARPAESVVAISGRCRARLQYKFVPYERGAFSMHSVHLRVTSRLGFWQRHYSLPAESVIHVYPDMVQLAEYAVLARTNRLSLLGVRKSRKIGQDHDFERLRDYQLDDNYRHIDWRATARRNRLTVKEYQTSQSQRIVFLLDCGRMMNSQSHGGTLLDHALNAALMLSYVALRQGDSVGLVCFSDRVHKSVPVRGGMSQMNHLLHASFDRFPQLVESRYDMAFMHLATQFRKRALVVLVTNLIDEVNSFQVKRYLQAQVGRHLPLGVLLRDHHLFDAADSPQLDGRGLFRAAAASEIVNWRRQVLTDLEHQGVLTLDVFPEHMTAPLVNRYLHIKARHLL
jgi:uncharacterized protein (DUF58 family)